MNYEGILLASRVVNMKVVYKNWYYMALYSILKQYSACRCVMVDIHVYLDIAFLAHNDT